MAKAKSREPQTFDAEPAKPKGTAVAVHKDWEKELAKHAMRSKKIADETATAAGNWLTFQGSQMRYKGIDIKNNETDMIVLGSVHEFLYYKGAFDPDNPSQPICFALNFEKGAMKPHEKSPKPQHADCPSCPHNQFGSATTGTGRGKACKNHVRLVVIPAAKTAEDILSAELGFTKILVTSVKNWSEYVRSLPNDPCFYVTRMSCAPDPKTQTKLSFELVNQVPKNLMPAVAARVKEAEEIIIPDNPYPPIERTQRPPMKQTKPNRQKSAPKY